MPIRRMFSSKNVVNNPIKPNLIDSTEKHVEDLASNEHMINAPQGSVASDIQQIEDNDGNSDIEQNTNVDDINFSSNAYHSRYFDIFH